MSQQVRQTKESRKEVESPTEVKSDTSKGDKIKADLDAILDEIDDVLSENLEQMAVEYVQAGGE